MQHSQKQSLSLKKVLPVSLLALAPALSVLLLCGCESQTETTTPSTKTQGKSTKKPRNLPKSIFDLPDPMVTDEEIARFVDAAPNPSVNFPERAFEEARPLILTQNKPQEGEKILREHLDEAVKAQAGQTKLGQYLVRFAVGLYQQRDEAKKKEAVKYCLLAQRIFEKQPAEKRPMANWFWNAHYYPADLYTQYKKYRDAEVEWTRCVNIATGAPDTVISKKWRKYALTQLLLTVEKQGNNKEKCKIIQKQIDDLG